MRKVKVTLTPINIYNTHDQSCGNIRYLFDISWKRIYGNYWDAYSSDSDYSLSDADGYRTSEHKYISEYSDNTKNDIDVDPDVSSSSVYAANYVKISLKFEIQTGLWCGYWGTVTKVTSYYSAYTRTFSMEMGNSHSYIYGGYSTAFFSMTEYS